MHQWCSSWRSKVSDRRSIQGSGDVSQLPAEVNRDKVGAKVMRSERKLHCRNSFMWMLWVRKHYFNPEHQTWDRLWHRHPGLMQRFFLCFWFSCKWGSWAIHVVAASLKESSARSFGKKLAKYSQFQYSRRAYLEGLGLTVPLKLQIKAMSSLPGCDSYWSMHLILFSLFLLNP